MSESKEDAIRAEAQWILDNEFTDRKVVGSKYARESPCIRIRYRGKGRKKRALKYAFRVKYGRDCRSGYTKSHRCQCLNKVIRSANKSGICINPDHICEQLSGDNNHRKLHHNIIIFYLNAVKYLGLDWGATYLRDVPQSYIDQYFANDPMKKKPRKVVCKCPGGCFVNTKNVDEEPERGRSPYKFRSVKSF